MDRAVGTTTRVKTTVPRLWPGSTVVCIAGGPSLIREDVEFVRDRARVIAVNDAYRVAPWADVLYACDPKWWVFHEGAKGFPGRKYALDVAWSPGLADTYGVTALRNLGERGLSTNPAGLMTGKNSGYQAINLAALLGASRVLLLGYDLQPAPDGKEHWFGSHPRGVRNEMPFGAWLSLFSSIVAPLEQAGVRVYNCSRRTALTAFPIVPLEDVL